jgi:hypothetical protein
MNGWVEMTMVETTHDFAKLCLRCGIVSGEKLNLNLHLACTAAVFRWTSVNIFAASLRAAAFLNHWREGEIMTTDAGVDRAEAVRAELVGKLEAAKAELAALDECRKELRP